MMKLYLVQHGEAAAKTENPDRPLTRQGRQDVKRVGAFLHKAGTEVDQIRHSGKLRAEETAGILAEELAPKDGTALLPGMGPDDDIRRVAELLSREKGSLMLVGHRPFMDRLAGLLLAGSPDLGVVQFRPGGVVCLEQDRKTRAWSLVWAVTPELLPQRSRSKV
jgi:phosphohistidine phosphatase